MLFYEYNCPPGSQYRTHPPAYTHRHAHTHTDTDTDTNTQIHIHMHTDTDRHIDTHRHRHRHRHRHTPLVISPVMVFILYLLEVVISVVNIMQLPSTQNIILHNANDQVILHLG